jgi:uncharacterized protein YndB with AHSA1/START domain
VSAPLAPIAAFDPKLDLKLERTAEVPVERVWKAWTDPDQMVKWFTPDPWKTVEAKTDLRAGGSFHVVMESPEGQKFPNSGCYLEIVPNRRIVWTGSLVAGFRPQTTTVLGSLMFTAVIEFESTATGGTKYTATVLHGNAEDAKKHNDMGFEHGWGAAWDQLVALLQGKR